MTATKIYQIFYDKRTEESLDKGFIPLSNINNLRPDWSEYWPIRQFMLANNLDDNTYYGFFSPKFYEKTKLTSSDVYDFISESTEDVISFSPYFDQAAYFRNIFCQANANHIGILKIFKDLFIELKINVDPTKLVMKSKDTIFCNYFVAKLSTWKRWFCLCEEIFKICETTDSPISNQLKSNVMHSLKKYPSKVFIIERLISLLVISNKLSVKAYNPLKLPLSGSRISKNVEALLMLDSLKISYNASKLNEFLILFTKLQKSL